MELYGGYFPGNMLLVGAFHEAFFVGGGFMEGEVGFPVLFEKWSEIK